MLATCKGCNEQEEHNQRGANLIGGDGEEKDGEEQNDEENNNGDAGMYGLWFVVMWYVVCGVLVMICACV